MILLQVHRTSSCCVYASGEQIGPSPAEACANKRELAWFFSFARLAPSLRALRAVSFFLPDRYAGRFARILPNFFGFCGECSLLATGNERSAWPRVGQMGSHTNAHK